VALLTFAATCLILAIMAGSIGNVLKRGPSSSSLPVVGGILVIAAILLGVVAVGFLGAWFILDRL
jgi:hypothetical protein